MTTKLTELVMLDKQLQYALTLSEKEYAPPAFGRRGFRVTDELVGKGLLARYENYPLFTWLTFICALASLMPGCMGFLALYTLLFLFAVTARRKFLQAYVADKMGAMSHPSEGFQLKYPALLAKGLIDNLHRKREPTNGERIAERITDAVTWLKSWIARDDSKPELDARQITKPEAAITLSKEALGSLTKIIKAEQEYGDVGFGIAAWVRGSAYGGVIVAVRWISKHQDQFFGAVKSLWTTLSNTPPMVISIILVLALLIFPAWSLIFSDVPQRMRKKRYLLILNILCESYPT